MVQIISKIRSALLSHKIISAIVLIALIGGGYYWYRVAHTGVTVTKYEVQSVATGTIATSVSGTGQTQAGTTIGVTPKVSEEVTSIAVGVGDKVSAGQLLLRLDSTSEAQSERSAELSLQSAQLALEQLSQVTTSTLLSNQDSVRQDETSLATASTTLVQDYQSGFDDLGSTFVNLQTIMTGLQNFVTGNDINKTQNDPDAYVGLMPNYLQTGVTPYKNTVQATYTAAAAAYQQNLVDYHAVSRNSSEASLDALFTETKNTANTISAAVKASNDFLTYVVNSYPASSSTKPLPTITTTLQNNFNTYTDTISSAASSMQSTVTGIVSDRNSIVSAQSSLEQANENLTELTAGPTDTQLLSAQISVESAENSLQTAKDNLSDTSVRAPISGTISAISAIVGETAGSSAVTIVSNSEVAQVTLNEIDAAKVQVGDTATLTFDAIDGLSINGSVAEIDPVGTVSQGVVSYNVQIAFSQPANTTSSMLVKPGMSVTADIVTDRREGVVVVPNAAVLTQGSSTYVMEPSPSLSTSTLRESMNGGVELGTALKDVLVTTGLAGDTMTEITSGVNVGDQVIIKTITSSASSASTKTTTTSGTSALQLLSGSTGGGGGTPPSGGGSGGGAPPS
jgi:multidrug efflux pump subunit AcrA (membrane-fusion protein)